MPETTPFEPAHLTLRSAVRIVSGVAALLLSLTLVALASWLLICVRDNKAPIDMLVYKAEDTKIGDKVAVTQDFYRTRVCEFTFSRMATDSKGRVIYYDSGERLINGPMRRVTQTDIFPIPRTAAPGTATFHLYAFWRCPNNIVHRYFPIYRDYADTFELTLKEGDADLSEDLPALHIPGSNSAPEKDRLGGKGASNQ